MPSTSSSVPRAASSLARGWAAPSVVAPGRGRKPPRASAGNRSRYAIAREVVAELEAEWTRQLGKAKMRQLRALLEELNAAL